MFANALGASLVFGWAGRVPRNFFAGLESIASFANKNRSYFNLN